MHVFSKKKTVFVLPFLDIELIPDRRRRGSTCSRKSLIKGGRRIVFGKSPDIWILQVKSLRTDFASLQPIPRGLIGRRAICGQAGGYTRLEINRLMKGAGKRPERSRRFPAIFRGGAYPGDIRLLDRGVIQDLNSVRDRAPNPRDPAIKSSWRYPVAPSAAGLLSPLNQYKFILIILRIFVGLQSGIPVQVPIFSQVACFSLTELTSVLRRELI